VTISDRVWKQRTAALCGGRVPMSIKLNDADAKAACADLKSLMPADWSRGDLCVMRLFDMPIDLTASASHVVASDGTRFDLEDER